MQFFGHIDIANAMSRFQHAVHDLRADVLEHLLCQKLLAFSDTRHRVVAVHGPPPVAFQIRAPHDVPGRPLHHEVDRDANNPQAHFSAGAWALAGSA